MDKYAIKIERLGRYVCWCEDRWYETEEEPKYIFSLEEAKRICKHLKYHCYLPKTSILDEDGNKVEEKKAKKEVIKASKNLFTLTPTLLKK